MKTFTPRPPAGGRVVRCSKFNIINYVPMICSADLTYSVCQKFD